MNPTLIAILLAIAAIIAGGGIIVWLINAMANSRANAALAAKDKKAAEHLATETVKAQETRNEIARSSFDDAVDRL